MGKPWKWTCPLDDGILPLSKTRKPTNWRYTQRKYGKLLPETHQRSDKKNLRGARALSNSSEAASSIMSLPAWQTNKQQHLGVFLWGKKPSPLPPPHQQNEETKHRTTIKWWCSFWSSSKPTKQAFFFSLKNRMTPAGIGPVRWKRPHRFYFMAASDPLLQVFNFWGKWKPPLNPLNTQKAKFNQLAGMFQVL